MLGGVGVAVGVDPLLGVGKIVSANAEIVIARRALGSASVLVRTIRLALSCAEAK